MSLRLIIHTLWTQGNYKYNRIPYVKNLCIWKAADIKKYCKRKAWESKSIMMDVDENPPSVIGFDVPPTPTPAATLLLLFILLAVPPPPPPNPPSEPFGLDFTFTFVKLVLVTPLILLLLALTFALLLPLSFIPVLEGELEVDDWSRNWCVRCFRLCNTGSFVLHSV